MLRCDWCISVLAGSVCHGSFGGPLSNGSAVVVFLDRGHPCFRNFYSTICTVLLLLCFLIVGIHASTIPVDVFRMKSYVNRLLDPARVPIRITINKLYFAPKWAVSGVVSVF